MSQCSVVFLARGGDIDGQQRQVLYLADGLVRDSVPLTAVVSDPGDLHRELLRCGVESRVARMSPWRSIGHIVGRHVDASRLLHVARGRKAQIIHAHDVWRAEYARYVARRLSVPYVVHVRGPLSSRDIRKHRLGLADAVIAIAQRYVDDLLQAGVDPKRIALIDDAVDLDLFTPKRNEPSYIRRDFGIGGSLLVGVVGRLSAFKRICEFLDAVRRLPPDVTAATRVVLVGEWEGARYRREVEAAVQRLGLADRVHFIGRCPGDLMPELLSSLDVLVTLSGGSTMFEAMAMSRPVLSIRADGRHSLHTRHGLNAWCVDGSDPGAAATALAHLLSHADLRRGLGQAARQWVELNLSSATMVAKVKELYGSLTKPA
jgi:glycosyltransferase involved in cell wall biosynthesis